MTLQSEFIPLALEDLTSTVKGLKADGARFVQILAVRRPLGYDLIYSFMKDKVLLNYRIENLSFEQEVPSITNEYLNAFVFENETHDLFGAKISGIAIDFHGKFYNVSTPTPMKFSEESKERLAHGAPIAEKEREARAAAAAKAAEEAKAKAEAEAKAKEAEEKKASEGEGNAEKQEANADDKPAAAPAAPEKPAEAPKAETKPAAAADADAEAKAKLEEKLKGMDPEKAAKVRAAMEAKAKKAAAQNAEGKEAGNE